MRCILTAIDFALDTQKARGREGLHFTHGLQSTLLIRFITQNIENCEHG